MTRPDAPRSGLDRLGHDEAAGTALRMPAASRPPDHRPKPAVGHSAGGMRTESMR